MYASRCCCAVNDLCVHCCLRVKLAGVAISARHMRIICTPRWAHSYRRTYAQLVTAATFCSGAKQLHAQLANAEVRKSCCMACMQQMTTRDFRYQSQFSTCILKTLKQTESWTACEICVIAMHLSLSFAVMWNPYKQISGNHSTIFCRILYVVATSSVHRADTCTDPEVPVSFQR